jgi:predicted HNH restriction endonuclease
MGKRQPNTPRSKIRAAIRQLWLRSRERAAALKRTGYCCERCEVKQSKAKGREVKVEVHHKDLILGWEEIIDLIAEHILCHPDKLEVLCVDCHDKEHIARKILKK